MSTIINDGREFMNEVIKAYEERLGTLRSGRANAGVLYGINVDY